MIAEQNFAATQTFNSARHLKQKAKGTNLSCFELEYSVNGVGGVFSSGTFSSSSDSEIPAKSKRKSRKSKNKLKRVKSKVLEDTKK